MQYIDNRNKELVKSQKKSENFNELENIESKKEELVDSIQEKATINEHKNI